MLADNYVGEEHIFFQFSFGMFEFIGCVYFRSHVRKKNTHRIKCMSMIQRERERKRDRANINNISMKAINLFAALYLLSNRNSPYVEHRIKNNYNDTDDNNNNLSPFFLIRFEECGNKKCWKLESIKCVLFRCRWNQLDECFSFVAV